MLLAMSNSKSFLSVSSIKEEFSPDAKNLYLLFGGIDEQMAMPRFEFYNSAKILHENKIFFRDPYQCWYQNGLPGIGKDVYEVSRFIGKRIEDLNPQNVYFVGFSMGGFAAIMFSALTGRGEAIAFSTRTSIDPFFLLKIHDPRHKKQVLKTYFYSWYKKRVWDLKALLQRSKNCPKVSLFVSKNHAFDFMQAKRLDGLDHVRLFLMDSTRHDIVRAFRDQGLLPDILSGKFNG